jgi:hypothetical protein
VEANIKAVDPFIPFEAVMPVGEKPQGPSLQVPLWTKFGTSFLNFSRIRRSNA